MQRLCSVNRGCSIHALGRIAVIADVDGGTVGHQFRDEELTFYSSVRPPECDAR